MVHVAHGAIMKIFVPIFHHHFVVGFFNCWCRSTQEQELYSLNPTNSTWTISMCHGTLAPQKFWKKSFHRFCLFWSHFDHHQWTGNQKLARKAYRHAHIQIRARGTYGTWCHHENLWHHIWPSFRWWIFLLLVSFNSGTRTLPTDTDKFDSDHFHVPWHMGTTKIFE